MGDDYSPITFVQTFEKTLTSLKHHCCSSQIASLEFLFESDFEVPMCNVDQLGGVPRVRIRFKDLKLETKVYPSQKVHAFYVDSGKLVTVAARFPFFKVSSGCEVSNYLNQP